MYKRYIKNTFLIILSILTIVILTNIFVDPGKIYMKKYITEKKADEYIEELLQTQRGLVRDGWNERLIKTHLAKKAGNYQCIILGSSHIMQISTIREVGGIQKQCKSLLNLGVSGGTFEDLFVFSDLILKNNKLPEKIFIDIDPWTLKFNMDSRYGSYMDEYIHMNQILHIKIKNKMLSYTTKILKNLINWEYFYFSIKTLKENKLRAFDYFKKKIEHPYKKFDYNYGYKKAVILSDGGHIYSNSFYKKCKNNNAKIPIGGGNYKIEGQAFNQEAVKNLIKLIELYQSKNVKVNFILTPYNPQVFKAGKTEPVKHMIAVEKEVKKVANKYNIQVYGSYFPKKVGCDKKEFLDFMHASIECLNKIKFDR